MAGQLSATNACFGPCFTCCAGLLHPTCCLLCAGCTCHSFHLRFRNVLLQSLAAASEAVPPCVHTCQALTNPAQPSRKPKPCRRWLLWQRTAVWVPAAQARPAQVQQLERRRRERTASLVAAADRASGAQPQQRRQARWVHPLVRAGKLQAVANFRQQLATGEPKAAACKWLQASAVQCWPLTCPRLPLAKSCLHCLRCRRRVRAAHLRALLTHPPAPTFFAAGGAVRAAHLCALPMHSSSQHKWLWLNTTLCRRSSRGRSPVRTAVRARRRAGGGTTFPRQATCHTCSRAIYT